MSSTLRSHDAILDALSTFPDDLSRAVIAGNVPGDLRRPASDGGWGVVEVLPHLRDWEGIYFDRIQAMVEQDNPHLPSYDDELWAIERDYRGQDPIATFEEFRAQRQRLVDYVRSLPADAWQRTGVHGFYGDITLHWMLDHICEHDAEHLAQARDALA